MANILDHFDALTNRGLKVIPLRENTKIPLCKGWTSNWNCQITRSILQRTPKANIGLILGDVIDVEGDSEEANEIITRLIGDIPHPLYRSAKSIHHLFINPYPDFRFFRWREVEFRGYGHQSVLPPSKTEDIQYRWLENFKFPIPPLPQNLDEFYQDHLRKKPKVKPGHKKAVCSICGEARNPHQKRFDLETNVFALLGKKWECQDCRQVDLRRACRLFRAKAPTEIILSSL